jgi:DNA anti-recombination protein RmuC
MPITEELKNIKKLESVGFRHEQAEALADIIEQAQLSGQESLKEFIRNENKDIRNEFNSKLNNVCNELNTKIDNVSNELNAKLEKVLSVTDNIDTYIKAGQYDLLIKIFAIVFGTSGVLFALLKLFG